MTGDTSTASKIAIVGMACRVPGADGVEQFWANLAGGVESIRRLSDAELLAAGLSADDLGDPRHVPVAALIPDVDRFDASFFGIAPREAELMDPQQRVFLECAWQALEHAGCDPSRFDGAVGVFAGTNFGSYLTRNLIDGGAFDDKAATLHTILANDKDYLATRVAYKLNLRGPAYAVQSACSTSLVAVHLAMQSLLAYECDVALAGGVAIDVQRGQGYWAHEGSIFSPDGHVRAFDAAARGTVFGNGAAIVALKRLDEAIQDGNSIYAVILGSAVNNDGSVKVGFTAPSVAGQSSVITEALADAGVPASSIGFVEAHGTGTPLGDPIEVEALVKAFGRRPAGHARCALGSVKTNIGHLDSAAGAAGLIKAALALHHRVLPPSLNCDRPNPAIGFESTPFFVNTTAVPWSAGTAPGLPRRAGVSSFGMGGTNAHVVLEEAPRPAPRTAAGRSAQLLLWSARSERALARATENLRAHLAANPDVELADVAHTLQTGRSAFACRGVVACRDVADAVAALQDAGRVRTYVSTGSVALRTAFLFPGQGTQYVGMGRELYESQPVFRQEIDACAADLRADAGIDLLGVLYPPDAGSEVAALALARADVAQPALFAVEYAAARLWRSWGIEPAAMVGYSLGEYVAACLAGVFSRRDALRLVARRGQLMESLEPGAMTAIDLPADALELDPGLAIAAINAPALSVVAGPADAVGRFEARLDASGIAYRRLPQARAFHSAMVEPIMAAFAEAFAGVRLSPPAVPFVSNVTGHWITAEEATNAYYWVEQLRRTVRFGDALRCLVEPGATRLLEVGPGRALSALARQQRLESLDEVIATIPGSAAGESDLTMLTALGRLWQWGAVVDWDRVHAGRPRRLVPLPTYPFDRDRYWIDPPPDDDDHAKWAAKKAEDPADWFYTPIWKQTAAAELLEPKLGDPRQAQWLVLAAGDPLSRRVVERLEHASTPSRVSVIWAGDRFEDVGPGRFVVDPRSERDFERVFAALAASGREPDEIVHLWSLSASPASDAAATYEAQHLGLYSLMKLARQMESWTRTITIRIVTANAQEVTGIEPLSLSAATLVGAARVLPQERSTIAVACLDIDAAPDGRIVGTQSAVARPSVVEAGLQARANPSDRTNQSDVEAGLQARANPSNVEAGLQARDNPSDVEAGLQARENQTEYLSARICAELNLRNPAPLVALRGRSRFVQAFDPIPLPRPATSAIRTGGTYVVLGGLGRIGLTLASHLASTARARLVLVGRTPLPDRGAWPDWLAGHPDRDPLSARIRAVQALERAGAEVMVVHVDIADAAALERAFAAAESRFGAIDGVIAAAGIIDRTTFRSMSALTRDECERQFRPKIDGLLALEAALRPRQVGFCLVVSSLSSVLGGLGYGAYASANAFMDLFVRLQSRRSGTSWTTVNWDAWRWTELRDDAPNSDLLRLAMTPAEAVDVFERVLAVPSGSQIVISTSRLGARLALWVDLIGPRAQKTKETTPLPAKTVADRAVDPAKRIEPPLAAAPTAAPPVSPPPDDASDLAGDGRTATQRAILDAWRQVLGVDYIELHDSFLDVGGSSLTAVQVINRLERTLGVHIAIEEFIFQTAGQLATLCDQKRQPAGVSLDGGVTVGGGAVTGHR